ncbi:MAG: SBBP repeat-containing protein [Bryobacteraceae bacterium]
MKGQTAKQRTIRVAPSFEEERDAGSARYLWRSSGTTVSLGAGGTLSINGPPLAEAHITFVGASLQSDPQGEVSSGSKTIYYLGPGEASRTASHFERVRYRRIYPGIDLVFATTDDGLEYNFEIAPYADPSMIRIRYDGTSLHLLRSGDLEMRAGNASIRQRSPQASQDARSRRRRVACRYRLLSGREVDLRLGPYDRVQPLFIDPVLDFSTYFGGSSFDSINAAATDSQGSLYVAGETSSGNLSNPSLPPRSSRDAFVAKFNSTGTLAFTVYLGGSNYDSGRGIALDPLGNIYVTGVTASSDFPVTNGAFLTHAPGTQDAFIAKFSPGFGLQYSTYLGGGGADSGLAIAVDSTGAAYVTGQTASTAFPVTVGAFRTSNDGGVSDCFVSKLNPAGNALAYSTFLGGSGLDLCAGIAVDPSGNAYVAGTTSSPNFPVVGSLQSSLLGTSNAFVTKVNATGSALVYSTYLGGSITDSATAIALDSSGAAYVTGDTASFDFPTTPGIFQGALTGQYNAFVSKLSAAGSILAYSTLVGGSGIDVGTSITIDPLGRAIVGGFTTSSNFPTSGAIQATFQGAVDAFAMVLDPAGASLIFSSYFGGSGDDRGYAVAVTTGSKMYLAGVTSSSNFPVAAPIQTGLSVAPDAFVMQISYAGGVPAAVSVTPSSGFVASQNFALQYSDTAGAANLQTMWAYFSPTLANPATNTCLLYYNVAGNLIELLQDNGATWVTATPGTATTLQNSQCSLNVAGTSVVRNGNTLTVDLPMTFLPSYAGAKNVYLYAADVSGSNSGWQQLGTWTVPGASAIPAAVSVTPSSGSVASQSFALQYSDTAGAASLQTAWVYFNSTLANPATNTCLLYYNVAGNLIELLQDNGATWVSAAPGAATTLQNSQCALNVTATSVVRNGASVP